MPDITKRDITEELKESYLDYAMSVIVSRALPDVRDGLKPVQRRVLWSMWDSGFTHTAKFKKSANVVGETLGRYHPHGDVPVYDALVRMAQDFSLRYPLVQGQGNFGSVDGDAPAAMRYTEARLSKIAEELLIDIEKDTVAWRDNYDATRKEPVVLPAKIPGLLLNGAVGIAVGMATNIPPHNLDEVSDALLHLLENPKATSEDLLEFVHGPDFPTAGIIFDKEAIREAYVSGKGPVTIRARADIEERKKNQFQIVVTELPYQVNKAELVKHIAELVHQKKLDGIRDLRDESDREGLRVVVELKNDVPPQKVLNMLYKHTNLQKDFHLNMIALVGGIEPRLLSLADILREYVEYRKEVVRRRTEFDLARAKERAHILMGLQKALGSIDKVIAVIKKSKDRSDAQKNLRSTFKFTELQTNAILEMRLQALAALEREKVESELKEKQALIKEFTAILGSPKKIADVIKGEVQDMKKGYGDARRTEVVPGKIGSFKEEDLVPDEETMITLSEGGYVKRLSPNAFTKQRRGGKGLIGSNLGEEDFLVHFVRARTHDDILFFTDRGRVFQTKVYEIPAASRTAKGRAIQNFLELPAGEEISAIVTHKKNDKDSKYLVMVTKKGIIKKTALSEFAHIRRTGIAAISLSKGDVLSWVRLTSGKDEVVLATELGQAIRFREEDARPLGRTAKGVRAITLGKGDAVAGCDVIQSDGKKGDTRTLLAVMANGYGKQTPLSDYKIQKRGGKGMKTANITKKTGHLIASRVKTDEEELFALSAKGQIIRAPLESVRTAGRATQGVRIMKLKSDDELAAIVIL